MTKEKCYEVVGIFTTIEELDQAVGELFTHGFDQSSLSIPSNEIEIKQKLKRNYKSIADLADNPNVPRTSFQAEENIGIAEGAIISVLIYIGAMVTAAIIISKGKDLDYTLTVIAIITGAATAIGILLAIMLNNHHKNYIKNQLKKGGLLLWVQLKNKSQANVVIKVLKHNQAINAYLRK